MEKKETVGQRIEGLRKERGLDRDTLEEKAGLRFGSLAGIESGRIPGNDEFFSVIAEALGISLGYLKTGSEDAQDEVTRFVEMRVSARIGSPKIAQEIVEEFLASASFRNRRLSDEDRQTVENELEEYLTWRAWEDEQRAFGGLED